ncbi:nitrate- and nitrite sensing domain-containing protein [Streptomyces sp. L2]|uniref:sensor histidine kinase n=1 Tax=Streptomyces sp. L2 TaxID=2162665 RepID=UPI0013E91C7B|nr:nitrate- and nitrite sensing domain-containing protein [Streptomyces sp. L2]
MSLRLLSIRTKLIVLVVVPLITLCGLWSFSLVTVSDDVSGLRAVSDAHGPAGAPLRDWTLALQAERLAAMEDLSAHGSATAQAAFRAAGAHTDRLAGAAHAYARKARSSPFGHGASDAVGIVLDSASRLKAVRTETQDRSLPPEEILQRYNDLIAPTFRLRAAFTSLQADRLAQRDTVLVELARVQEYVAQEEASLAGIAGAAKPDEGQLRLLDGAVEAHRLLLDIHLPDLDGADAAGYEALLRSGHWMTLERYEGAFLHDDDGPIGKARSVDAWRTATRQARVDLDRVNEQVGQRIGAQAGERADDLFRRNVGATALGVLAILLSVAVSALIGQHLARRLVRLRNSARDLAHHRLPDVLERLRAGEEVDVAEAAPLMKSGRDEIGEVGHAFNTVQLAAVDAAVRQAEGRRAAAEVFVNLARRNQVLLDCQHASLDAMERRTTDPDELAELFRLDHLATRMRRHAEGLIILTGGSSRAAWDQPESLFDVVRAAAAEVEDYSRIVVRSFADQYVHGHAVTDLTHLIAELLENAMQHSPARTQVTVDGMSAARGFVVEIDDRGLGMGPEALEDANLRVSQNNDFDRADAERLGLLVVGRLAHRHGVKVNLRRSAYGGVAAVVLIPNTLLTQAPAPEKTEASTATAPSGDGSVLPGPTAVPRQPSSADDQQPATAAHPDSAAAGRRSAPQQPRPAPSGLPRRTHRSGHTPRVPASPEEARVNRAASYRGMSQGRVATATPYPSAPPSEAAPDTGQPTEGRPQ